MPLMNGKELIDKIRLIIPGQKALFMSGFTDNTIVHQGVLDEGIPYIRKPYTAEQVAIQIRKLLS
jgi:response regulator RpfG family c-di-GMP phosphodiesterase